jgi:hypothetical protein
VSIFFCFFFLSVSAPFACHSPVPPVQPERCAVRGLMRLPQRYTVKPNTTTAMGIAVDTSGTDVNLADLDRRARAVAECLGHRPEPGCTVVKVVPDAVRSCSGPYLLLPIEAPGAGCAEKGQDPSAACPCRWRAGIQPDGAILVPPDLYNLGDPLVRIWGNVNDPWRDSRFATCALAGAGMAARRRDGGPPPDATPTPPSFGPSPQVSR